MVEQNEHSAIVEGLRAGTNEGLAAFYDLYADKLYDFARRQLRDAALAADVVHDTVLIVKSRIGQLRDESKFRAWVYAIVRNEVRAKARARSRHVREEYAPEQSVDPDFAGDHDRRELASLIDEAVAGLTEREQEVFHLFARQGLSNDEIAASLELTFANAQKLVQRVRDRIARSAGALLVARQGRKDCSDLNVLLVDWDGTFSPLWRKRIARHVDECGACERKRAVLLQPGGAVMAAPYFAAPESLRSRIFDSVAAGVDLGLSAMPKPPFLRRPAVLSSVAGIAFVAVVGVVANNGTQAPQFVDSTAPAAPSTTVDSTASADAAATVSSTVPPPVAPAPQTTVAPVATTTTTKPGSNSPSKFGAPQCSGFGNTKLKAFTLKIPVTDPQGVASVRMRLTTAAVWHAAAFQTPVWSASVDKVDIAATKATVAVEATDKDGAVTSTQVAVYASTCP
ncbi:MAG: sigma-70 family RNA polymerase sigma factor [Acidobacteria bacterium]|nr:sigma-70 family RNA polymerase sigma factor [Acidobacteriota bacterium]